MVYRNNFVAGQEIQNLILANKSRLKLDNIANLRNINLEIPPQQFNFDLSCNDFIYLEIV